MRLAGRLTLRSGEILGLAGRKGSGRRKLRIPGALAMNEHGLFDDLSVKDNLTMASLGRYGRFGLISPEVELAAALDWMTKLNIHARSPWQKVAELSGGDRQKVQLARLMMRGGSVLWLDEPTRGADPVSRLEIHGLVQELAAEGHGILWIGDAAGELRGVCDTIALFRKGRVAEVRPAAQWTESEIIAATLGSL